VQAHAATLGDAIGGLGIGSRLSDVARLDAIPEASPWLAAVGAGRNARSQRCCGEQSRQRFLAGQRVLVVGMACLDHALDAPHCSDRSAHRFRARLRSSANSERMNARKTSLASFASYAQR
jgi:hypothetical protein